MPYYFLSLNLKKFKFLFCYLLWRKIGKTSFSAAKITKMLQIHSIVHINPKCLLYQHQRRNVLTERKVKESLLKKTE